MQEETELQHESKSNVAEPARRRTTVLPFLPSSRSDGVSVDAAASVCPTVSSMTCTYVCSFDRKTQRRGRSGVPLNCMPTGVFNELHHVHGPSRDAAGEGMGPCCRRRCTAHCLGWGWRWAGVLVQLLALTFLRSAKSSRSDTVWCLALLSPDTRVSVAPCCCRCPAHVFKQQACSYSCGASPWAQRSKARPP